MYWNHHVIYLPCLSWEPEIDYLLSLVGITLRHSCRFGFGSSRVPDGFVLLCLTYLSNIDHQQSECQQSVVTEASCYGSSQMENPFINNETSSAPFSSRLSPSLPPAVVTTALSYVWAALIRVIQWLRAVICRRTGRRDGRTEELIKKKY